MKPEDQETQPNTLPDLPARERWWCRFRYELGTAGLVTLIAVILAVIFVAASTVPVVRNGFSKVIHHGGVTTKNQSVTPKLRDGTPSRRPAPVDVSAISTRTQRTVGATPSGPRSPTGTASPSRSVPVTRPASTPTTPQPTPTSTLTKPVPTSPAPTSTTASPTATVTSVAPATN